MPSPANAGTTTEYGKVPHLWLLGDLGCSLGLCNHRNHTQSKKSKASEKSQQRGDGAISRSMCAALLAALVLVVVVEDFFAMAAVGVDGQTICVLSLHFRGCSAPTPLTIETLE